MRSKKSQSAIEFVVLVGVLFFFFTMFFIFIQGNMSDKIEQNKNIEMNFIANLVRDEINLALSSTNGYYREFEVPEKIGEEDYNIDILEGIVYIHNENRAMALPVANITGNVQTGINNIKKIGGKIYLNEN